MLLAIQLTQSVHYSTPNDTNSTNDKLTKALKRAEFRHPCHITTILISYEMIAKQKGLKRSQEARNTQPLLRNQVAPWEEPTRLLRIGIISSIVPALGQDSLRHLHSKTAASLTLLEQPTRSGVGYTRRRQDASPGRIHGANRTGVERPQDGARGDKALRSVHEKRYRSWAYKNEINHYWTRIMIEL